MMAAVLGQSSTIVLPALVAGQWHGSSGRSGRPRNSVKVMSALHAPSGLAMRSGLRRSNALDDLVVNASPNFHAKVASSIYFSRGKAKASRFVPKAMFENFTDKALKVILLSQEEARLLGHNFVGTEQILLGLIGEGTCIPAKVLKPMGITLGRARTEVEKIIGRGSGFVAVEIPFTPRAKLLLELSLKEALDFGHGYVGPEHLLLGLLEEGDGVAVRVLENLGADPYNIRAQVLRRVVAPTPEAARGGKKMPKTSEDRVLEIGFNVRVSSSELKAFIREVLDGL